MNKFQRVGAGIYGAIENTLDDIRHNFERFIYGRKVTGEVDMFPPPVRQGAESTPDTAALFDKLYGRTAEREPDQGREREPSQPEHTTEIER